jgi:hypothetical protein
MYSMILNHIILYIFETGIHFENRKDKEEGDVEPGARRSRPVEERACSTNSQEHQIHVLRKHD